MDRQASCARSATGRRSCTFRDPRRRRCTPRHSCTCTRRMPRRRAPAARTRTTWSKRRPGGPGRSPRRHRSLRTSDRNHHRTGSGGRTAAVKSERTRGRSGSRTRRAARTRSRARRQEWAIHSRAGTPRREDTRRRTPAAPGSRTACCPPADTRMRGAGAGRPPRTPHRCHKCLRTSAPFRHRASSAARNDIRPCWQRTGRRPRTRRRKWGRRSRCIRSPRASRPSSRPTPRPPRSWRGSCQPRRSEPMSP